MPIFVWDEAKREANIFGHGIDFADAERFDWQAAITFTAHPGSRGEARYKAIGMLDDRIIAVIFAPLGTEAISIISMRPASPKERRAHAKKEDL